MIVTCQRPILTGNPLHSNLLDDLPNELVLLDKLTELKVDGNPMKNIPDADQGGNAVFHFLLKRYKGNPPFLLPPPYRPSSSSSSFFRISDEEGRQEDDRKAMTSPRT